MINDFYIPVLANSIEYYRMSGFFSSSSLAISAQGISNLISRGGKMKLICSAVLSEEDKRIIEESNENPERFIEKYAINDFNSMEEGFVRDHVEALGWMLANNLLEIKIAIPIMTTHASLSSEFFLKTIREINVEKLLIVDEVHGKAMKKSMLTRI